MSHTLTYGSVCSGIEAASVAWEPIGWKPAWFSEIEPFPCSVLQHHWQQVANLGDMTAIAEKVKSGEVVAPDVLVGGTPCQAFSVAGMRQGLADSRGQLTLSYVELLNAIDTKRSLSGDQPAIAVWENVPGVLSSADNAFGCFLAAIAGADCELQPPGGRWKDAGCVFGPKRAIAWRCLDAQYFGLAQRRKRVFVIASARHGFRPEKILFEFESLRRDIAPRRESQESIAGTIEASTGRTRGAGINPGTLTAFSVAGFGGYQDGIDTLRSSGGDIGGGSETLVTTPCWWDGGQISQTLDAVLYKGQTMPEKNRFPAVLQPTYGIPGNWIGRKPENGGNAVEPMHNVAPCLTKADKHGVATFPINTQMALRGEHTSNSPREGVGIGNDNDPAFTLQAAHSHAVSVGMMVRRITPIECERLQGFPDNHTNVPHKGKPAADSPRYKALGNSMAVPCMAWIGRRIDRYLKGEFQ